MSSISSPRKQGSITIRSDSSLRPESLPLEPIPEEAPGLQEEPTENKGILRRCFRIEDTIIYVTYLHGFYILFLLTVFVYFFENTLEELPRVIFYPAVGVVCLISATVLFLANRALEFPASLILLKIWQVVVVAVLVCYAAYVVYRLARMPVVSTTLTVITWVISISSILLFIACHLHAIFLTYCYHSFVKERRSSENEISKWRPPRESYRRFQRFSHAYRNHPRCDSFSCNVLPISVSSPIKKMAAVTISEAVDV